MLGPPRTGELAVALPHDERQVDAEEADDERRHEEDVGDEEPVDDLITGVFATEDPERGGVADDGHGLEDREHDPDAGPRQQIVEK